MSLQTKLFIGFGGMLLILLAVGGLSLRAVREYSHTLKQLFHENYISINAAINMRSALIGIDRELDIAIVRRIAVREDIIQQQIALFEAQLDMQRDKIFSEDEAEATRELADNWQEYKPLLEDFLGEIRSRTAKEAMLDETLRPLSRRMMLNTTTIYDANMSSITLQDGRFQDRSTNIVYALVLLITSGTTLGAIFLFLVGRFIMQPIYQLTESANQIQAGNLDHTVRIRSADELGHLGFAFNSMAAKLREFRATDQARLMRVQQTTQLAIDSLRDAVIVCDPDGRVEVANKVARELFSIPDGANVRALQREWLTKLFDRVCREKSNVFPKGFESTIQIFEGTRELFFLPNAVPIVDNEGVLQGVTIVIADVTVLRRLDELKSGMVATVSHELKTPLTSIRMAIYMLNEGRFGELSDKQQDLISTAQGDCDRLFTTIENLLDLSRIQAGALHLEKEATSPKELVDEVVEPLRDAFHEANVDLDINLPQNLPAIYVDSGLASVIITNLLTNALKYSGPGTTVSIHADASDPECLELSISDSGPGIPAEYTERVFDKFFRLPGVEKKGAGLGLAIARDIVVAHGGRIVCEGDIGKGTTFKVYFPMDKHLDSPCS
jgi:two-component system, NtrC family, sensor histidine kinase KinB